MARNHRMRFAANNLAAGSGASCTASSANGSFPFSNALDTRRWKTWKTTGNFTITAGTNDKLYVNDGSDRVATITAGNYSGGAALATAVQTALNAVSSGWTVSYSSTTYRFTITPTGSRVIQFATTTAAAWDTLGFVQTSNLTLAAAFSSDEMRIHTSENIVFDLGYAPVVGLFALVGKIATQFPISSGATVRLYANHVNTWTSPAKTYTLAVDTQGVYKWLDEADVDNGYRYWKFEVIDRQNTAGPAMEFAYVYLGTYDTVLQSNVSNGFEKRLVDTAQTLLSESGAAFYSSGVKYLTWTQAEVANMDAASRRTLEQTFYDCGRAVPLFISFDPTLASSDESGEYTAWVFFQEPPGFTQLRKDVYSVTMSFREVV